MRISAFCAASLDLLWIIVGRDYKWYGIMAVWLPGPKLWIETKNGWNKHRTFRQLKLVFLSLSSWSEFLKSVAQIVLCFFAFHLIDFQFPPEPLRWNNYELAFCSPVPDEVIKDVILAAIDAFWVFLSLARQILSLGFFFARFPSRRDLFALWPVTMP